MKTRSIDRTLTLAAALTLAGLLPAAAPAFAHGGSPGHEEAGYDHGGYRDDGYRDGGGYDQGYDGYGRGGRHEEAGRTRDLARRLAQEARRLHREAEQVNPRPSPPVARMLVSLHRLDEAATRFDRHLATCARSARHQEAELADVLAAWDDTLDAADGINPQRYLREGLARIDSLVGGIGRYDRYASYDGGYGRGHGRFDGRDGGYGRGRDRYGDGDGDGRSRDRYRDGDGGYPRH